MDRIEAKRKNDIFKRVRSLLLLNLIPMKVQLQVGRAIRLKEIRASQFVYVTTLFFRVILDVCVSLVFYR